MADFLSSGVVGNIELNEQKRLRKTISERWEQLGFVDGLEGSLKENIATLYENQAKQLLSESNTADNSGSFETVVFPIVRRIFSKLLANDIVSVQAMTLPVGRLFFFLPVTSERVWDAEQFEDGFPKDGAEGRHTGLMGYDRVNKNKNGLVEPRYYLPDEVINGLKDAEYVKIDENLDGEDSYATFAELKAAVEAEGSTVVMSNYRKGGPENVKYFEKSLYDLFYNDFLYDNSRGKVNIHVAKPSDLRSIRINARGGVEEMTTPVVSGMDGTVRNMILEVKGFSSFNAGKLTGPDGNEMDTESFLASLKVVLKGGISSQNIGEGDATVATSAFSKYESIPFRVVTQKYGKGIVQYSDACDADGKMYIELDFAKPSVMQGATIDGYVGINTESAQYILDNDYLCLTWAQYDSLENETEIGEVGFKLESVTVSVESRKLRATWSPELAQDVNAFHNIDAESELTALLSEQIAAEIDREILRDLRKGAPWQARWDVNGWRRMAAFSTNYTQKDWNQELMTKINQISAQIHKSTLRGGANFIVVSSEISALFDNLEYFHVSDASAEEDQYNMGIERIGSLSARYQVYRDPYSPSWSMIIGHKGKSLLDTGYIYAPYIPMQLTPTIPNPMNFSPVKGIMTRYAKKMVNNRYFGHVRVDGLVHWDINEQW